jgi:hypothetical protein
MRRSRSYVIAGLLAAGVLFAGCGGDDSESDTAADTGATTEESAAGLSEEDYRTEVEGVLTPLGEELQTIGTETSGQTTPEGVAQGLADTEEALQTGIDDLGAIEPPEELQEPHDRMIAALEDFRQATTEAREGAESGDLQAVATDYVTAATDFQQELQAVLEDFQAAGLDVAPGAAPSGGGGGGN